MALFLCYWLVVICRETAFSSPVGFFSPQIELSALQSMIAVQEDELQVQAADLESLTRNIQIKEDLIKVFHSFSKPLE